MDQTFDNHARFKPLYHFVAFGILLVNFLWTSYQVLAAPSISTLIALLLAVALIIVTIYARAFAITVQDRVIRLEMRLRLREVLPADVRSRIDDLTVDQLVSLRFASDQELPELTRQVLDQGLTDRNAIKLLIKNWRPDYLRA